MILRAQSSINTSPASEAASWISFNELAVKIYIVLATLVVYDASMLPPSTLVFTCLTHLRSHNARQRSEGLFSLFFYVHSNPFGSF